MIIGASTYNRYTATLDGMASVPADVEAARVRLGLTPADVAAKIGIGADTLFKLGATSARSTLEKCLTWLATV